MMYIADITVLAVTKLRTRRIRTGITVFISSLLFACLIAALLVAKGSFDSIQEFNKQGLGSRYIVQAQTAPLTNITQNKEIQLRAREMYNQQVVDKTAAAKKLGIEYDPQNEKPPILDLDGQAAAFLDITQTAGQMAVKEHIQAHPQAGRPELEKLAAPYHPTAFYDSDFLISGMSNIATMEKGVENFSSNPDMGNRYQNDLLLKYMLTMLPAGMTNPFILPEAHQATASRPDAIPIIVSYSMAEKILGLAALPNNASASQQLDRLRELYRTAHTGTFSACYRNVASSQQIQEAIATELEIKKNKNNKEYQKPDLIYGLPAADSCGPATVVRDVRTAEKKTQDAKQKQFDAMFGAVVEPDQQKLEFRIVGLMPNATDGAPSNSARGIMQGLVQSSLSDAIVVPQELYESLPSAARYKQIFVPDFSQQIFSQKVQYVEFANPDQARNFIDEQSCSPGGSCSVDERPFTLNAFASNSIALRDLQRKFETSFKLAALAAVGLAVVIMTGTVGRMIADSRRETAVFRAVGAGRLDIASVYTLYVVLLSLCIAVFALALGVLVARVAAWRYGELATVQAQLIFGGSNLSLPFHLFAFDVRVLWVMLAAVGAGLVSLLLPLLRNIRRSPIKDMRDE